MKTKTSLLAILSVATILGLSAAAPAIAGETPCPPNITSHVDGDVFVDDICTVTGTGSVDGNIKAEGSDAWLVMNGDLDGNIEAKDCLFVVVRGSVDGNVKAEKCTGSFFGFSVILPGAAAIGGPATINGNVEIKESNLFIGPGVVVDGNVKVEDGLCLVSPLAIISGNLEGTCAP